MQNLGDLLGDDTNQFGPGTDLTISLVAMLLVISLLTSHLYRLERGKVEALQQEAAKRAADRPRTAAGGNFKLASESFSAADFYSRPVTRLVDEHAASARVEQIVRDYRSGAADYPFVFVIGHSNQLDDPDAEDRSVDARRRRNMEYALRRAALVASLLQERLTGAECEHLVAASTGEFDLRRPDEPTSSDNAWVEVVFGREWKLPGRDPASAERSRR
jgi:hypothetical protein